MCGLVAVFNKYGSGFTNEQRDTFNTLLLVDTLRGEDSTGAFVVEYNGDVSLAKQASTGSEFLRQPDYKKLATLAYGQGACMVGHNRKATKGVVNDENAHPFTVDDKIVLVHNGGIFGDHKEHADVEVDSHAIAHLLVEHKDPAMALGKFYGAYALIWYDVEEETVNLIRNDQRPLYWMETDNAWVWSSEASMLEFAAARLKLRVRGAPTMLKTDCLTQYRLKGRSGWELTNKDIKIQRPVYQYSMGSPSSSTSTSQRKAPWETDDDYNDYMTFRTQMERAMAGVEEDACALPQDRESRRPDPELNRDFIYTVGGNRFEKTSDFEKALAKTCNKMVTAAEFQREVVNSYHFGMPVIAKTFDYVSDGAGGWYLYSSPEEDPSVIIRHYFPSQAKVTEERVMHMALNEYTFEFNIDTKSWSPFDGTVQPSDSLQKGYCLMTTHKAKILKGGGVETKNERTAANA